LRFVAYPSVTTGALAAAESGVRLLTQAAIEKLPVRNRFQITSLDAASRTSASFHLPSSTDTRVRNMLMTFAFLVVGAQNCSEVKQQCRTCRLSDGKQQSSGQVSVTCPSVSSDPAQTINGSMC
jgi:hypothetical protein